MEAAASPISVDPAGDYARQTGPGDPGDGRALLADCYAEIRRIARALTRGREATAMQPTELVHEAMVRMLRIDALAVRDRGHMLAISARVMRQTLIDEFRRAGAAKRHAPPPMTVWPERDGALLPLDVLDDALAELGRVSGDHAAIVELRFMLGMTVEEAAAATGLSARTVKRRWQAARAWLQRYLEATEAGAAPAIALGPVSGPVTRR